MEKKLSRLFDYQKFADNPELRQVIDSVHARYAVRELSAEDMEIVNAAGVPELPAKRKEQEK